MKMHPLLKIFRAVKNQPRVEHMRPHLSLALLPFGRKVFCTKNCDPQIVSVEEKRGPNYTNLCSFRDGV